ncbi:LOW QUALITY PROTEIN: E3 ubiquitin-protein ligase RNF31 [Brienomyrus brachyistius]|uniref:LOW QUALITY PROTEIN: E3 ubiquitin-protein ligase RNF31 n=1 Tax=Brienomyrus brachyistius TaxID=42636 RepID=UPI0020B32698|nr:LOW QUALITY PROTEIN: E3 ubiquitin-protein ligase RNF31 [Brienomyrus brachyistius]
MANLSDQLEEMRAKAEARLSATGSSTEVKADILAMADIPLPLSAKYRHIAAEAMVEGNGAGESRHESFQSLQRLSTALNILEKYGCNLTCPTRPKYWRSVKHNNPVFKATVDAISGGRAVLCLYGYTNQQPDGLSFPDDVIEPDITKVAAITVEVMTLRMELDMLIKDSHPHPEFFERVIPSLRQEEPMGEQDEPKSISDVPALATGKLWETEAQPLTSSCPPSSQSPVSVSASKSPSPHARVCCLCGGNPSLFCPPCGSITFCESCDLVFHRHPSRASHRRELTEVPRPDNCTICGIFPVSAHCPTCVQRLCSECDRLYHSHPGRTGHIRDIITAAKPLRTSSSSSPSTWQCVHCTTVNKVQAVFCVSCERTRPVSMLSAATAELEEVLQPSTVTEWQCKSCTVVNAGSSVLCEVCERPRLATRPPVMSAFSSQPASEPPRQTNSQWVCQFCTYANSTPSLICEMCDLPRPDPAPAPSKLLPQSPVKEVPLAPTEPKVQPPEDPDLKRQKVMREQGLKLIQLIREGERKGISPEEVYTATCISTAGGQSPCDWLKSELPHLLDEICAMAASVQSVPPSERPRSCDSSSKDGGSTTPGGNLHLSRAEAKQAWLAAGGDTEKAVKLVLRERHTKVRELCSLGLGDTSKCAEALRLSGGELRGALSLLQRPLLESFHQRMWSDQPEPSLDVRHPDKQRVCRRLLAIYDLPSWGRCELALSLLQDPGVPYTLEDVVQAVRESHDRDFIRRVLTKECPICLSVFPHSKMQSLTSCQCSVCCDCFQQHFTIAVRDKHIRDMVCPVCWEPDINDPEHLNSYFSTLDIQLRECLEPEVYELFHKKLTEQALIKDPKFLWCSHCSCGFIYDGDQLKVTCFHCRNSFCAQCKKPWESQHAGLTCEQFQAWKRENDPEYQRQGLAGYLRDNGITCPSCRFQYALSKGGCMHFTCSQCRYQFCSGCNNPFHTTCSVPHCSVTGLHAHHPRDCLFYLRDWEPARLQALLQKRGVAFNTEPPHGIQPGLCSVMEQKDDGGHQTDAACGAQTQPGQAGLCEKHYREYLVSLINGHSIDPALLYDVNDLLVACRRYQVDDWRGELEEDRAYYSRLLKKLIQEVPLGDKVPRKK